MKQDTYIIKPFIKWAGGKTSLVHAIKNLVPKNLITNDLTFVEPFVGGGAVFLNIIQSYKNIKKIIINDKNKKLINLYITIKNKPIELINLLNDYQNKYIKIKSLDDKQKYFLENRELFNSGTNDCITEAALFIFLNKTCFNGLYRENKKGFFNVPFGKHVNPPICDKKNILAVSKILQVVDIYDIDFSEILNYVKKPALFYFDPPYRPISETSNFNSYTKAPFDDNEQLRLRDFCNYLDKNGYYWIASNSNNNFLKKAYSYFNVIEITASRYINATGNRGRAKELLITNIKQSDSYMKKNFSLFLSQLKETNATLSSMVDFKKIISNTEQVTIKLNQLNYLIGKENLFESISLLFNENPKAFEVLNILIAIRNNSKKKVIDKDGNFKLIQSYFKSPKLIYEYMNETGLKQIFNNKNVTNLVDYVFGIEVGLDTNARKNRGGKSMAELVFKKFEASKIKVESEVSIKKFPDIESLGVDNKVFDFVIKTSNKTYLIETNFYNSGGSKLNEVARAYSDIDHKINKFTDYSFVWITDGIGWKTAKNKLEEAYQSINHLYNIETLSTFIDLIKADSAII